VLVEGEEDRAAILAQAALMDHDFDAKGISVIPVNGKANLPKVAAVFESLELPVYVIWDSDKGDKGREKEQAKINRALCRLVGRDEEDFPEGVAANHACFETNLGETIKKNWEKSCGGSCARLARMN